jgi:hypothetical protein
MESKEAKPLGKLPVQAKLGTSPISLDEWKIARTLL